MTVTAESVLTGMTADFAEMMMIASVGIGLSLDRQVQSRLRDIAGVVDRRPFLVGHSQPRVWFEVAGRAVTRVHRHQVDGLPSIDLDHALMVDPVLAQAFQQAVRRPKTKSAVSQLLDPILGFGSLPTREEFASLQPWTPLIEQLAYRSGTRLMTFLDTFRPQILRFSSAAWLPSEAHQSLTTYWTGMHTMANLIFLASEPEAGLWLSALANEFQWQAWTPTFPLLRERTVWLAGSAARSAAAFGPIVVDKYLRTLATASDPIKVFDALFGLATIALTHPSATGSIVAEIKSLRNSLDRRTVSHPEYFHRAYRDALEVMETGGKSVDHFNADCHALGWQPHSGQGLATGAALRADPIAVGPSGRFLGFAVLPAILVTKPAEHYPRASSPDDDVIVFESEVAQIISRAWGGSKDLIGQGATRH